MRQYLVTALVFYAALVFYVGCTKTPPDVTPEMKTLYVANDAVVAIGTIQHAAIELNKQQVCDAVKVCKPLLNDANTRIVVDNAVTTLQIMGPNPTDWKAQAKKFLDAVEQRLDAAGNMSLLPYVNALKIILGVLVNRTGDNYGKPDHRDPGSVHAFNPWAHQGLANAHG